MKYMLILGESLLLNFLFLFLSELDAQIDDKHIATINILIAGE